MRRKQSIGTKRGAVGFRPLRRSNSSAMCPLWHQCVSTALTHIKGLAQTDPIRGCYGFALGYRESIRPQPQAWSRAKKYKRFSVLGGLSAEAKRRPSVPLHYRPRHRRSLALRQSGLHRHPGQALRPRKRLRRSEHLRHCRNRHRPSP